MKLKLLIFCTIFINQIALAQRSKVDTIYIYEKVIIRDTIFLEKAIKLKQKDFIKGNLDIKPILILNENTLSLEKDEKKFKLRFSEFKFGIDAGLGLKNSVWSKEFSKKQQFGEHLGIWISKNLFNPRFTLLLSANVYKWNSSFNLDATKEETFLYGFYFTKDNQPILFQKFNNQHLEYSLQMKFLYQWQKLRPMVGIFANKNNYKIQFLVPNNKVLNQLEEFIPITTIN